MRIRWYNRPEPQATATAGSERTKIQLRSVRRSELGVAARSG